MLAQDRDFVAADPSGLSPRGEAFRSAPLSAGLKPCSYAGKALGPRFSTEQFVYPLADGQGSQSERGHIWALRSASRYLLLHQGGDDSPAEGPQVGRLAGGYQVAIPHDLTVLVEGAGVNHVILDSMVAGGPLPPDDTGGDEDPGGVANGSHYLALLVGLPHQAQDRRVAPHPVGGIA